MKSRIFYCNYLLFRNNQFIIVAKISKALFTI